MGFPPVTVGNPLETKLFLQADKYGEGAAGSWQFAQRETKSQAAR
jgi:hypothetical protein